MKRLWLALALIVFSVTTTPVLAESSRASFSVSSVFDVRANDTTLATHNVTVTNTGDQALLTLDVNLPASEISALSINYADGKAIPFNFSDKEGTSGELRFNYRQLTLNFPRRIVGKGEKWRFKITYIAKGLVDTSGTSHSVFIPHVGLNLTQDNILAVLRVPNEYAQPNYQPAVTKASVVGEKRQFSFSKSQLTGGAVVMSFGRRELYDATFKQVLSNKALWPRLVSFSLPPDLNNQTVFIKSITPKPTKLGLDEQGNIQAEFWLWPRQSLEVVAQAQILVRQQRYALGKSTKASAPADLADLTIANRWWGNDGAAAEAAKKLVKPGVAAITNVRAMHDFVLKQLKYDPGLTERLSADQVLKAGRGGYLNYADLLIAMLRSQGIPARAVVGSAHTSGITNSQTGSGHAWVEAYVSGIGWMSLDPLWAEKFTGIFGNSPQGRIGLRAIDSGEITTDEINGLLKTLNLAPSQTKLPARNPEAVLLGASRNVILPGVVWDITAVTNGSGYVVDHLKTDKNLVGSLAPGETKRIAKLSLAGFSAFTEKLSIDNGKEPKVLKEVSAGVNFWPFIILVLVLVSGVIMLQWHKRKLKAKAPVQPVAEPARTDEPAPHHDVAADHVHGSLHYPDAHSEDKRD